MRITVIMHFTVMMHADAYFNYYDAIFYAYYCQYAYYYYEAY